MEGLDAGVAREGLEGSEGDRVHLVLIVPTASTTVENNEGVGG
jgi:hypothetical protein